jgi:alpha-amylase
MPSCGGPGGHYQLEGQGDWNGPLDLRKEDAGVSQLQLVDEVLKGMVEINWDCPAALWRFPVETVSQSESGWEKTYQSSVVMPIWHLELNPGEKWRVGINLRVDW